MIKLKLYSQTYNVTFTINKYIWNESFALTMEEVEDGCPCPVGTVTVCLADYPCEGNRQFVDINNNTEAIMGWLIENNLGQPTGRIGYSGYCEYPEFEFNLYEIKKHLTDDICKIEYDD